MSQLKTELKGKEIKYMNAIMSYQQDNTKNYLSTLKEWIYYPGIRVKTVPKNVCLCGTRLQKKL
jgi:hypothetical protein